MFIETFPVPPLGCNCVILGDEVAKEAIVIDPGGDAKGILRRLRERGITVKSIVHTHTHIDHVGATAEVQRETSAPARIHEGDLFLYDMLEVQGQMLGMRGPARAELDSFLRDDETLAAGAASLTVLHTPGHTPGSVCFQSHDGERAVVLSGDTLFQGSIGRTDLWGGDSDLILTSIRGRLLSLPDDTVVIPGHGGASTIGDERRRNPFLRAR
ncbi:MAG: MBL fold metallo-hydrolase [Polyangiales bacterium]